MLAISSPMFTDRSEMPPRYTCQGEDVPPELRFQVSVPGVKSLALIVDDPDAPDPRAPKRVFVHWVVYNIPPQTPLLGAGGNRGLPSGAREGKNGWGETGYRGPCPPVGRHRYFFKLYALDALLPDLGVPTKAELLASMKGHILEEAELVGTYEKVVAPAERTL
jgi:Raf kinase inhibitor-like YbhB/YbcL family protein